MAKSAKPGFAGDKFWAFKASANQRRMALQRSTTSLSKKRGGGVAVGCTAATPRAASPEL